jgi:hypothetical protein
MRTDVYCEDNRPEPLLITAKQAAQRLGISTRYLYTLTKNGQLRAKSIGSRKLYRLAELQRFCDEDEDEAMRTNP